MVALAITPQNHGQIIDLGPGDAGAVSSVVVQFLPTADFVGSFAIVGRCAGAPPATAYFGIPYRRVNVGGLPSDYAIVSDPIAAAGIAQIPAALAVALLVSCTAGSCQVLASDLSYGSV